jgi:tripartite ATP-independent transporter DctP family solute receptor
MGKTMNQLTRRSLGAGLTAAWIARPALAQTMVLRAAHTNAIGEVQDEGLRFMDRRLREITGGKLGLQIFPNGQLGNELPMVEGVALGTIDLAVPSHAAFANFVKEYQLLDMPFLIRDYGHLARVAATPAIAQLATAAQARGFRVLGLYSSGVRHLMTRDAVTTMAELRGKKIRTQQNPVHVAAFNAFGANATPLAYGELYSAIQVGVVDGAEAAYTNFVAQKFYEVAKHWTTVGWLSLTAPIVLSERKYQSLTPDLRNALMQAGEESAVFERQFVVDGEAKLVEEVRARGVTITDPDKAPFQAAARPLYDRFLQTAADKARLKLVQETA